MAIFIPIGTFKHKFLLSSFRLNLFRWWAIKRMAYIDALSLGSNDN